MDIGIVCREMIKPFSISGVDEKSPFKISLIDQLTPSTYSPLVLFYPSDNVGHFEFSSVTHRLKTSLSQTLTRLYPLSGRLKDNLFMDNFDQGVPYVESRVPGEMSQFLRQPQMEWLNHFLPCRPYAPEPNPATMPQLGVQVNVFNCGGIVIGLSLSHKLIDGATASYFLKSWSGAARGSASQSSIDGSVLEAASTLFPPVDPLPHIYERIRHDRWFGVDDLKVRRFVFDAEAVAGLRAKARSEYVTNPTRSEVLSNFVWKHAMSASEMVSGCPDRISMLSQAVNLRPRAKPPISDATIGNVFWSAEAATRSSRTTGLPMLVKLGRESVEAVDSEFVKSVQADYKNKLGSVGTREDTEVYGCSSWLGTGFDKIDFGWGVPIWVGAFGDFGGPFMNTIMLKKINAGEKGIEAWVALQQNVMDVMEKDPHFLAYACLDPPIIPSFT